MQLRPYQLDAHDAVINWIKTCFDPCLVIAATGAGKSVIIAAIAKTIHGLSGKKILVTAPSGELVDQNYGKYTRYGEKASIYSASLGKKSMLNDVVFGTPQTIKNNLRKFGSQFSAIIIDEAHGITPTLRTIIDHMLSQNPKLRIIGLTATPYRLNTGYIYANHFERGKVEDDETTDPFFHTAVYEIGARMLIDAGYLTTPIFEPVTDHYDTAALTLNNRGQFNSDDIDRAFLGKGRKTAGIVQNIVENARERKGVMIFAATIQHAHEIMESLPHGLSAIVTGDTDKGTRAAILAKFKAGGIKYLVNVSVLTTGFDAPNVDLVAIMRATESVGLLQQIIGRGLRLNEGKENCLVLDYAENIDRHCPHGDIFAPIIKAKAKKESVPMNVFCPLCNHNNQFSARPNPDQYLISADGYFIDLAGTPITTESGVKIPAHFGRRCQGEAIVAGIHRQCAQKWSVKECPACSHENDIAARYCQKCREEIVDPNEKLKEIALKMASDPYRPQFAPVINVRLRQWPSMKGGPDTLRVDYIIDGKPSEVSVWYSPESPSHWMKSKWDKFCIDSFGKQMPDIKSAIENMATIKKPGSIGFRRKQGSKYYELIGANYTN